MLAKATLGALLVSVSLCAAPAHAAGPKSSEARTRKPRKDWSVDGEGALAWAGVTSFGWYVAMITLVRKKNPMAHVPAIGGTLLAGVAFSATGFGLRGRSHASPQASFGKMEKRSRMAWAGASLLGVGAMGIVTSQVGTIGSLFSPKQGRVIRSTGWLLGGPMVLGGTALLAYGASFVGRARRKSIQVSPAISARFGGLTVRGRF